MSTAPSDDFTLKPVEHYTKRPGKAYVWLTWLSRFLSGDDVCQWKLWFKANHKYQKLVDGNFDSEAYRKKHDSLVAQRASTLRGMGHAVAVEHELKWEGRKAIAAGRADILASRLRHPPLLTQVFIDDVKTGNKHNRDKYQIALYMLVHQKQLDQEAANDGRQPESIEMVGEVIYGDSRIPVHADDELTPTFERSVTKLLKIAGADNPPDWSPSRRECEFCDIPKTCCPKRIENKPANAQSEDF